MNKLILGNLQNVLLNRYLSIILLCAGSALCSALIIFYSEVGLFIIIAISVLLLTLFNLYVGLLIIIISFPFLVGFSEGIDIGEAVFVVLFAAWLVGWIFRLVLDKSNQFSFSSHPLYKPTLMICCTLFLGSLIGLLNGAMLEDILRDLSQYGCYLVLLPAASVIKERKKAVYLLIILLIIGLPSYIWSAFVWWSRKFAYEYAQLNIAGVGSAYFSPFVSALLPLTIFKTKRFIRLFASSLLLVYIFYIVSSGYRSSIISATVMIAVTLWIIWAMQTGLKKLKVVIPFVIGLIFILWVLYGTLGYLPMPGGEKTRDIYSSLVVPQELSYDRSVQGRLIESKAAFDVFREHPMFGQGFGYHLQLTGVLGSWYETSFRQHIWYTEILMKFGLVGALVFAWYIFSILRYAFSTAKRVDNLMLKAFTAGLFVWITISLVPAVGSWSDRGFAFMVGLMLGILPVLTGTHPYLKAKIERQI